MRRFENTTPPGVWNAATGRSKRGNWLGIAACSLALSTFSAVAFAEGDEHGNGDAHGEHGEGGHAAHDEHGGGEVNWFYGILGESDDIEHPTLLFRTKGMPVPLGAQLLNTFALFYILYRAGRGPVINGLKVRRESIMKGIDAASKMKAEAQQQLAGYEAKLAKIDSEIDRVRREMREAAHSERTHILEEARKRRERMERDAKTLIQQELKAARELLLEETVRGALGSAQELIAQQLDGSDQQRLQDEYLAGLRDSLTRSGLVRPTASRQPGAGA